MTPLLGRLALGALAVAFAGAPAIAFAVPTVYSSAPDDGTNGGIVELVLDSVAVTLNLYLDSGELAYEYVVGFEATPGLTLHSFVAENSAATVNFDPVSGTLAITESLGDGTSDPVRIGSLAVLGTLSGGELRLADLPDASTPFLTNASFGLTPIPLPQTIARVPEPDALLLFWVGILGAAQALRRTRQT